MKSNILLLPALCFSVPVNTSSCTGSALPCDTSVTGLWCSSRPGCSNLNDYIGGHMVCKGTAEPCSNFNDEHEEDACNQQPGCIWIRDDGARIFYVPSSSRSGYSGTGIAFLVFLCCCLGGTALIAMGSIFLWCRYSRRGKLEQEKTTEISVSGGALNGKGTTSSSIPPTVVSEEDDDLDDMVAVAF